jgi:alpha-amylase
MRSICLYFQVHQPYRLRTYRFFNIGDDHQYYDDYQNRHIVRRVAEKCYIPANKMMLELIQEFGSAFRLSFSISGTALEQLSIHAPEVILGFQKLAETGCVEFLAETYSHSLASLGNREEFFRQVEMHSSLIEKLFGQKPVTFRNSELIYSDEIGEMVSDLGFKTMMTEGAKHILGWKSPNYMYCSSRNPKLKLLLRNFRLSDDIAFRFDAKNWPEWPITAEKFTGWLNGIDSREEVVNVFIDYETIGERLWKETGIFEFFKALPKSVFSKSNFKFRTPSELTDTLQPVAPIHVPYPISWADEERDLTSWLGNELQDEAFSKLYALAGTIANLKDRSIHRDWSYLQTTDHFYYMCTKWFSDGAVHKYFNPYPSPYEAFINYMNVLSDFIIRVEHAVSKHTAHPKEKETEAPAGKAARGAAKPRKKGVAGKKKQEGTLKAKNRTATTKGKPVEIPEDKVKSTRSINNKEKPKKGQPAKTKKEAIKIKVEPAKNTVTVTNITRSRSVSAPKKEEVTYKFSDIPLLSDKLIKTLIRETDIEVIGIALKGAAKGIREKVEKNFGKKDMKTYLDLLTIVKKPEGAEVRKSRTIIAKNLQKFAGIAAK